MGAFRTSIVVLGASLVFGCGSSGGGSGPDAGGDGDASTAPDRDSDGLPDDMEVEGGCPSPDDADSDDDGLSDGFEVNIGTDPCNADTDGDGISDGDEVEIGTDPLDPNDEGCAAVSAEASQIRRPADLIIAIDTSGSMGGEADAVEARINNDLAGVLDTGMVDYKIILVADFPPDDGGDSGDPTLCIGPPLAPQDCSDIQTPKPVNGTKFFHYDSHVDSRDSLVVLIDEFDDVLGDEGPTSGAGQISGGWGTLLREDSLKVFIEISDDNANNTYTAGSFNNSLVARWDTMYPQADPIDYVFHSIIGIAENPAGGAWPAGATVEPNTCGAGAVNNGSVYQELSNMSDGLRFPLCDNDNFNDIFSAIADAVISGVQVPCRFTPVDTGMGVPDPNLSSVVFTPSDMSGPEAFDRVNDASVCVDGAYYFDAGTYTLCPATCDRVRLDEAGKVNVVIGCEGPIIE